METPRTFSNLIAIARAVVSEVPPASNGTIRRIGLLGYISAKLLGINPSHKTNCKKIRHLQSANLFITIEIIPLSYLKNALPFLSESRSTHHPLQLLFLKFVEKHLYQLAYQKRGREPLDQF